MPATGAFPSALAPGLVSSPSWQAIQVVGRSSRLDGERAESNASSTASRVRATSARPARVRPSASAGQKASPSVSTASSVASRSAYSREISTTVRRTSRSAPRASWSRKYRSEGWTGSLMVAVLHVPVCVWGGGGDSNRHLSSPVRHRRRLPRRPNPRGRDRRTRSP
uniref:Uncharacterized protein n=1 Tax=Rhodococcus hoagii TaxID=43767 RepID=Q9EY94_RHOHA|nr:hypothetical protein [Prescottella equi]CAQ30414.1 hypothetical protein pVAPA_0730 [Prescottella equi]